jgi:acyl dehydratase
LHAETEVMEVRASESRPNAGIVIFRLRAFNQRDEMVCEALRSVMVKRA